MNCYQISMGVQRILLFYSIIKATKIFQERKIIIEWLLDNLEWLVGSIITILGLIFGVSFIIKKNVQKSGKNSTNVQIGEINYDKRK